MFKWFAPLLVFAAKPDLLLRALTLAIAGGILAFGVWLLSNVAVTFDTLKSPYIAATYAIVLACFFILVGAVTWLRVRRLAVSERQRPTIAAPEAPPLSNEVVGRRAEGIARKWLRDGRREPARVQALPLTTSVAVQPTRGEPRAARASLTVTGPAYSGKSALIATLVQATRTADAGESEIVRLIDAGSIDGDRKEVDGLVANAGATDGIVFVVDQDLRAPEVAAIARLTQGGIPLYVVLNKADQFTAADGDTVLLSIRAKMPGKFPPGRVVAATAAPGAVQREIEDARGAVRVELRRPPSDVHAVIGLFGRALAVPAGKSLKFEAA